MIGTLLEKLFVSVGVDLSGFGSELDRATQEVDSTANDMKRSFADVGRSWQQTGTSMMKAGAVMTGAVTAPILALGLSTVEAAKDAQEMGSAFDVVFGDMAASTRKWAEETGNAMGRSTQEMQRGALAFQELFGKALDPAKATEMSKTFAVLTQDLASFKNLSNEVAQQKLFSGLTGEAEPLRAVGVFLNDAAVEAKLLEMGIAKVNGKFTDQQKILGRAALIREQLKQADGDVIRTSDSLANQQRAAQSAWEELSVTVGTTLIPALTPLVALITDLLTSFNQLDPGVQTFIIGAAAVAAAIGPLLMGLGAIVSIAGTLLPMLGGAGMAGAFAGIGAAILPVTAVVAGLVAAWMLFGDKIGPVLSDLWSKVQEVLGPKLMALVETVKSGLTSLWQGPFGDAIRLAIAILGEFGAVYTSVMGEALIRIISAAVDIVSGAFTTIVNAIKLVVAVLTGDWAGAWEATKALVSGVITTLLNVINSLAPGATAAMKALYDGVKTWIWDRLNAIWEGVKTKIETVKGWFFGLYDAVVGHSYIPDMVDEIGQNMARLQSLMVDPAKAATSSTKEAFRGLASDVSGVLDRLFPLQAQLRSVLADIATLDKARAVGQIDAATYDAARGKLDVERRDLQNQITPPAFLKWMEDIQPLTVELGDLSAILGELPHIASEAELALQDFGERLGDGIMGALRDVLSGRGSLKDVARDMLSRFFERTITDALKSLETSIFGEGGLGGFLGGLFSSVISGRAVGGPVVPGRAYTVGAGEKFVPSQTGRVLSRSDAMAALGGSSGGIGRIAVTVNGARGNQEIMEMVRQGVQEGIGQYDRVVGDRVDNSFKRRA